MKRNNYGFFIEKVIIPPLNYDYCYSINQNLSSFSLYLKGILYNNASLLFFTSVFNLFQSLNEYTSDNKICYESYSQALTTHFLKYCDKMGLIKIISCEQDGEIAFDLYYKELNNQSKKYLHKVYDVKFLKIRSFNSNDFQLIKSILRFLNIEEDNLIFKIDKDQIKIDVNPKLIINSIKNSAFKNDFKDFLVNYSYALSLDIGKKLSRGKII